METGNQDNTQYRLHALRVACRYACQICYVAVCLFDFSIIIFYALRSVLYYAYHYIGDSVYTFVLMIEPVHFARQQNT